MSQIDSIHFRLRDVKILYSVILLPLLSGCATHCGLFTYCDIPENWPVSDTFTVAVNNNQICISGTRRASCLSEGMFQAGARLVEIHTIEDEDDGRERLASLIVNGAPGDHFIASCYEYNGDTILGFTEVLIGVEVRDRLGLVVAEHPTHPVVRRNSIIETC